MDAPLYDTWDNLTPRASTKDGIRSQVTEHREVGAGHWALATPFLFITT
jgi:hypothetical protein